VNTDAPWPSLDEARSRVLEIQTKLHRWATDGPGRQFDDLFNLVMRPGLPDGRLGSRAGQSGSTNGGGRPSEASLDRRQGRRGAPARAARRSQGARIRSAAGARADDSDGLGQVEAFGDSDGHRIPRGRANGLWVRWRSRIRSIRCVVSGLRFCTCVVSRRESAREPVSCQPAQSVHRPRATPTGAVRPDITFKVNLQARNSGPQHPTISCSTARIRAPVTLGRTRYPTTGLQLIRWGCELR
jgi:hypothetical protein